MEIKLDGLTKVFTDQKTKNETVAVDHLCITIPSGKLVGLLGPSGCGKSTTLYMISGLLNPTEGRIFFGDEDVTDLSPEKRGIGLVFQNYALYPHMTIRQNIMFPLENLKYPKEEAISLTEEMAKLVGIYDQLDKKPGQLSGGQQQRVAIARALVKKPRVLLLDEPLSNLDARLRLQTREEIRRIQRETGITTIFVTHDQEEAMSISDEIVLMNFGLEKQKGAPQKVYDNPSNLFVAKFLGTPPINLYDAVLKSDGVYINKDCILTKKINKEHVGKAVVLAVRPEGYVPSATGKLKLTYDFLESIGRDLALVARHGNALSDTFRVVINDLKSVTDKEMSFDLKPEKAYIFDKETEERVY